MRGIRRTKAAVCLLFLGLVCLAGSSSRAQEEEPSEALIQMIVELLNDADRDMRALGLQQVREEAPGEAATKEFVALLPKLPPDGQAGLLEALGDRGDVTARPAALEMLKSREETVRVSALRALGALGDVSDVALLAQKAATGSKLENAAARQSLVKLRGDKVNASIVSTMANSKPNVRVELLGVLAARNAKETLPIVLKSAKDSDTAVRLAALGALRFLADENQTATIVEILKAAKDNVERRKAELTLLVVCSRGRQACAEAIIAGLVDADVPSRIVLLHLLARAGGMKALEAVVARLEDEHEAVRGEAVRMLSIWPDPAVVEHLLAIAETAESPRRRVLAIRGLVRLASPQKDKPADLKMLAEAMGLAKRPQEIRMALGVLGGTGTSESLVLVIPALDDPALVNEAGLAAVMIAEKMTGGDTDLVRTAMELVQRYAENRQIRDRARKVLASL